MNHEVLLNEMIYIEDECNVILYNLTAAELKIVARVCVALADLLEDDRNKLYDKLNLDRIEANELYDDESYDDESYNDESYKDTPSFYLKE